jgi:hypothetical protein
MKEEMGTACQGGAGAAKAVIRLRARLRRDESVIRDQGKS